MAVYGNIGAFDEETEKFEDYADRFNAFMAANDIADDKKTNLLLASIGPISYKLLKNLTSPAAPNSKTYNELILLLKSHIDPQPIVIAERHKFWTAMQEEDESLADFVVRLKKLSSTCCFGTFLEEALRDRLVSALHKKMMKAQKTLLTVKDLTFREAKEKCIAEEMAAKATQEYLGEEVLETNKLTGTRHKVYRDRPRPRHDDSLAGKKSGNCRCCGGVNHKSENCRFKFSVCHACNKKGHIKSVCKYSENSGKSRPRKGRPRPNNVYTLEESENKIESQSQPRPSAELKVDSVSNYEAFGIYNTRLGDKKVKPYKVTVNIGNVDIIMELDTGATCSTISEKLYYEHLSGFPLHETNIALHCYILVLWFQFLEVFVFLLYIEIILIN